MASPRELESFVGAVKQAEMELENAAEFASIGAWESANGHLVKCLEHFDRAAAISHGVTSEQAAQKG